jgi:hypothetical protein
MSNNPKLYKTKKLPADMLADFDSSARLKKLKAISVADYRSERGAVVAALLEKYATPTNNKICIGYADRLRACADCNNFYLGDDFVDKVTGELFSGYGTLFGCGLKLCQSCTARSAARNRATAQRAVENTELQNREYKCFVTGAYIIEKERYRFATLTMPEIFASFKTTLKIQKRAWDLFRKLEIVKNYFPAIIKSVEFTVRENRTYHDHIHLLTISFFIPEALMKQAWTDCVRTAFKEFGVPFLVKQAHANFELVRDVNDSLKETCKYLTKTTTWDEIPPEQLIEIAEIERWDRLFEVSGRFRKTLARLKAEDAAAAADSSSVNKKTTLTDSVAHELNYLDTDAITDGDLPETSESSENSEEISKKPRRENWRDVIRRDGLEKFREKFYRQVEFTQKIRKLRLILKYPDAKFTDLDGCAWDLVELERFALQIRLASSEIPR